MLYQNTGVESFLQEVFKPVQTIDEFILQLHKAISCVQEDVPVARIEGVLNCVDISLSERAKEATIVLFDEGRAAGAPEVYESECGRQHHQNLHLRRKRTRMDAGTERNS